MELMASFTYLSLFVFAVVLGAVSTWTVRRFSVSKGLVDSPSSERHVHKRPIPRLGGVAIYLTFITVLAVLGLVQSIFSLDFGFSTKSAVLLLVPGTAMFLVGLFDDFYGLSPQFKLGAQIVGSIILYALGFEVFYFPLNYASHDL